LRAAGPRAPPAHTNFAQDVTDLPSEPPVAGTSPARLEEAGGGPKWLSVERLASGPPTPLHLVAHPLRFAGPCCGRRRANQTTAALPQLRTARNGASESLEDSMSMLLNYVKSFARQDEGQDLLEYALLVALIALIAIGAVGAAGGSVSAIFTNIAGQLTTAS
jgi:Flp pilus assembly pilin Flp